MQKMACTTERRCINLLSLPESLIVSILRQLPTRRKCQAERVCRAFRELLGNPTPGSSVWDELDLTDPVFHTIRLPMLKRWLLGRVQGVHFLKYAAQIGARCELSDYLGDAGARKELHVVFTLLPMLTGLLAPGASVHLDTEWVNTGPLLAVEQPDFVSQYWQSMSAVLTRLELTVDADKLTEAMSEDLCQLTQLRQLDISAQLDVFGSTECVAVVSLDLPLLEKLVIAYFDLTTIILSCPQLVKLELQGLTLKSFCGMPSSVQDVHLVIHGGFVQLKDVIPAPSIKRLEYLTIEEQHPLEGFADPETVKQLCLNGKLRCLNVAYVGAATGAFSADAFWPSVPQTLQHVDLDIPLDKGIPKILEQLPSLVRLSLAHNKDGRMHLDRPLDPFLDMPRLKTLHFQAFWQERRRADTDMCLWTPAALILLGLAEKRILHMRMTPPRRSITFIC